MKVEIPTLRTNRFILRDIIKSDIGAVFKGLSHPEVIRHYGISFKTLEETEEQLRWFADPKQNWWAICSPDNQEFYGAGGLNNILNEHKKAEIGLWLLPEFWGQGMMTEALPVICNFGFNQLGLHRIEGFVETDNHNCKKAMAKLDFVHEGCMKDCEIKNGKFISLDIYAKLNL